MKKNTTENILTAVFTNEAEAYKALSEFRRDAVNGDYAIANAALVKKQGETLSVLDGFDTGIESRKYSSRGWFIGMLFGIFGGFFGILFGGCIGSMIGSFMDSRSVRKNSALMQEAASWLPEGETALLFLVSESTEETINARLSGYETIITRTKVSVIKELQQTRKQTSQQNVSHNSI